MVLRDSHTEYTKRMHRVVEYIDQHLDEPLELSTLAKVAHFSAFHFHRLFSVWMRLLTSRMMLNRHGRP